ncbi:MAG: HEAT repeat domain-containing protein [Nitrospiraceae bacterium]|nr:HEAT repeat domain-containing protein [Nitrospiraceae bacterium]
MCRFILVWVCSIALSATCVFDFSVAGQSEEDVAKAVGRELQALAKLEDYPALVAQVDRWKAQLPEPVQTQLLIRLIRNLSSKKQIERHKTDLKPEPTPLVIRSHNFFSEKGRSALALEQYLRADLSRGLAAGESGFQRLAYESVIEWMRLPHEPLPDIAKMSVADRAKLAGQDTVTETVLNFLARDDDAKVRREAAKNFKTGIPVLADLLRDADPEVRAAAKANLSRPRTLADDPKKLLK